MAFGDQLRKGFWLTLAIPAGAALCFHYQMSWAFVIAVVVGLPILDATIGPENSGSGHDVPVSLGPRMPAYFAAGWWFALAIAALHARHADAQELVGLTVACGLLGAMAMSHGHELIHRDCIPGRLISSVSVILAGYPHYRTLHRLHHENVGDPAYGSTAAVGKSLWRHVPQSVSAGARQSLQFESRRSGSRLLNRFTLNVLCCVAILVAAFAWGGAREEVFCFGSFAICMFLVEAIGYLQHYGLDMKGGRTPSVIAWDMEYWLSNRMFVNNGRHTHHHMHQTLNYGLLEPGEATLPSGYFLMLWTAFIPRLWFSVMNDRVVAVRMGETSVSD